MPDRLGVGYLRVSTVRQAEDGYGLDVQEAAVTGWAETAGVPLVAVLRDEGLSGSLDMADRPGLAEAVAMIVDGQAGTLVVARLDRLARSLTVQEAVLAAVWRAGGTVVAVDFGEVAQDDPDDPMRTAIRQVMGAMAQLERGMIRVRLTAGRRRKVALGGYGGGAPAYGWEAVGGELVAVDAEQQVIELARRLYAGGSLRQVAAALNQAGHVTRRGTAWRGEQVRRVLARAGAGVLDGGRVREQR